MTDADRVEELKERIKRGTALLWEKWKVIRDMKSGPELEAHLDAWDEGFAKLDLLCDELKALGYELCLWLDETPRYPCLVCPRDQSYWDKKSFKSYELETEPIQDNQVKAIHALARKLGLGDEEYRRWLKANWGVDTCRVLSRREASEAIAILSAELEERGVRRTKTERRLP